jgi:hypothetical protein|tara:strand:- start:123 stop:314 length:192 start_codon:yes stop_codon:yes gene_type:complete
MISNCQSAFLFSQVQKVQTKKSDYSRSRWREATDAFLRKQFFQKLEDPLRSLTQPKKSVEKPY